MDNITSGFQFFGNWHEHGFWYAATGMTFKDWIADVGFKILDYADVLIVGGVVLGLLAMLGSNRAKKWLWWDIILYLLCKLAQYAIVGGIL